MIYDNTYERYEAVKALTRFPYFILDKNVNTTDYRNDLIRIKQNYVMYKKGVKFNPEGTGGDYVPSMIRFKNIKYLINKEARFMFAHSPDIAIVELNENDQTVVEQYNKLIKKVLEKSHFSKKLLQSVKDCLIGKRIAMLADISEDGDIRIHFYNALHFYYEYEIGTDILQRFVCYENVQTKRKDRANDDYLVNEYTSENGAIYVHSAIYDSAGVVVEELIPKRETALVDIPVVIVFNDGTLDELEGVSEVEDLEDFERGYTKMSNSDIDSVGKGMNPIRYVVDINSKTTNNLSSSAGSFWDLKSEQNQDEVHPQVGTLAPALNHTEPLKATLNRLKMSMHEALDVPNINEETLSGTITSGKALKALYYPLMVRCDEKLITWKEEISNIVRKVIEIALLNVSAVKQKYILSDFKEIQFDVNVQENYALLDDVNEEMQIDLDEIAQNARSRKSYIDKWRRNDDIANDKQIEDELMQIAVEQNMFDTTSINMDVQGEIDKQTSDKQVDDSIELKNAENDIKSNVKVGDFDGKVEDKVR